MKSIVISSLSKQYTEGATIDALKNVSFEVDKGELFGLIGPDGAGKTTLFRILTTLLLPTSGKSSIEGYDTVSDWREIRQIVGYMPGKFSLYQDLSIDENLHFFAKVFNTTVEENLDLIRDIYVQIEPFKTRKAGKLSGGMKQKLALCCALIHKPKVLLLDEPTTGVDPVSRREFWDMLKKLKSEGISILVSTPYMDEAVLCDRIALIQSGSILSIDTPQAVISRYKGNLYAVSSADSYGLLEQLRQQDWVQSCYMFGEYLHVATSKDEEVALRSFVSGQKDMKFTAITPTVEDCFIQLLS